MAESLCPRPTDHKNTENQLCFEVQSSHVIERRSKVLLLAWFKLNIHKSRFDKLERCNVTDRGVCLPVIELVSPY